MKSTYLMTICQKVGYLDCEVKPGSLVHSCTKCNDAVWIDQYLDALYPGLIGVVVLCDVCARRNRPASQYGLNPHDHARVNPDSYPIGTWITLCYHYYDLLISYSVMALPICTVLTTHSDHITSLFDVSVEPTKARKAAFGKSA